MYNEFDPKHYKGKWPCTIKTLYNEKTLIGRLHQYFLIYFETFSVPTADTLFLLILSILTSESAHSIRFLYQHFLSGITEKSLNVFYYACSYTKMVRSCKGIEMLVNLINISYCAMKILPYHSEYFYHL